MPDSVDIDKYIVPPRKEALAVNIAVQLKALMFRKKLQAGDKLPSERDLSRLFNVSRVVIKQALLSLEHSGFIEIKLGTKGGAYVKFDFAKPVTNILEDLHKNGDLRISHFQVVRKSLECAALQEIFDQAEAIDLSGLIDINNAYGKPENRNRHSEINVAFHIALADISRNPLIKILISAILEMVYNYAGTTLSDRFIKRAYDDHERIIQAIRDRDQALAERLLIQNIDRVESKKF